MAEGGIVSLFEPHWLVRRIHGVCLRRAARARARGWLLDVGCGTRPFAAALAPLVEKYVGIDFDRLRYHDAPPNCWGSALALPFRDDSFATVLASQVLEHVPEPAIMLAEIVRVLEPGGHLILTAPHIWGIHEPPNDYFRFTSYGLDYLARRAGLQTLECSAMAGYWVTVGVRFCYYLCRFEKAGLVPVRLLYLPVQLVAWGLDHLHRVESDAWNFLLVARKEATNIAADRSVCS